MTTNTHNLKTASFEDGTYAVLRADPANPRLMEVIATFYDAAHAHAYARSAPSKAHREESRPTVKQISKAKPRASQAKSKQLSAAKPKLAVEAKPKRAAAAQAKRAPEAKARPENAATEVSGRQAAVLKGLRSLMDKKNRVEVKAVELASASAVPLGSLHSILVSLEKKHMIRTERRGSPKLSAIYEVLESSRKSARSLNGVVHAKAAPVQAAR